jgi:hypothetical protein
MGERLMLLMMDEFLFLPAAGYSTILPLLTNGASMLLTSSQSASPTDEIKRMLHAKMPDGREIVLRLDWIRACAECTAKGVADQCRHLRQQPQHFQRSTDQDRMQSLMKPFGDEGIDRELFNITGRATIQPVFERSWLEPLRDRACDYQNTINKEHRFFFVSVDPAGDGFSQCVLVSATMEETRLPGSPVSHHFIVRSLSLSITRWTGIIYSRTRAGVRSGQRATNVA